ncbi:hypothetical protein HERIO_2090 [Hepatospora eriocheir]|uniref:ISXO2-like transposase domain-containing protein n=1 Tax=Hepatospora eriocheir TaxID=1081669 RepID=A0A1X0Q855_9MICR|nr:hypothetical protein HERIO_2090 [Hepatospora eriocheir]
MHFDEWNAYLDITSRLRFFYSTVNHSESFVNAFTGVYTQNIESAWSRCKYLCKMHKGVLASKMELILNNLCGKPSLVTVVTLFLQKIHF